LKTFSFKCDCQMSVATALERRGVCERMHASQGQLSQGTILPENCANIPNIAILTKILYDVSAPLLSYKIALTVPFAMALYST
jgi:hypothetical protein